MVSSTHEKDASNLLSKGDPPTKIFHPHRDTDINRDTPIAELYHKWVTNEWSYFGNTGDEPMEGSCGSPILDEEGNAVSFFRFLNTNGWAVGIAASTLEIWGYKAV